MKDIKDTLKLVKSEFNYFGLTLHCGDKKKDGNSKTEAMFFSLPRKTATAENTVDILRNENNFFPHYNKFKYLGRIFTPAIKR